MARPLFTIGVLWGFALFVLPGAALSQQPEEPPAEQPLSPDAQTPPPPPPSVSSVEPVTPSLLPPAVPRWAGQVEVKGGWDSNPLFLEGGSGSTVLGGVQGSVTRAERFRRGSFFLLASGGVLGYKDQSSLNQATFAGQTGLSLQTSQATSISFDGNASRSYTRDLQEQQVDVASFLPQVIVNHYGAGATLSDKISSHSSLSARVAYEDYSFSSTALESGHTIGASASFVRQLSKGESIGLTYGFQRAEFTTQPAESIHSASVSWAASLSRGFQASANLGATAVPGALQQTVVRPLFGGGLQWHDPRTKLEAHFARTAGQAYGYGTVRYSDFVTLGASEAFGSLTLFGTGSLAWDHDPTVPAFHNENIAVGGGLRFVFGRSVSLGSSLSWRRWSPSTLPTPVAGTYALLSLQVRR